LLEGAFAEAVATLVFDPLSHRRAELVASRQGKRQ
jgi:hypothetical protein